MKTPDPYTGPPVRPAGSGDHSHYEEVRREAANNQLSEEARQRALPPDERTASGLPADPGDAQGNDHEKPVRPAPPG